jgi:NADPH-dependent 2,4-dienoyl-CoA reductase/sulfur reductase-like enzyme
MSRRRVFDLAVVGAGPAGMAAATIARKRGADVVVFDEQVSPGGQMYRAITSTPVRRREVLGLDYWHGTALVDPFRASGATYLPATTVWAIAPRADATFEIAVSATRRSVRHAQNFHARVLVLAPGAVERPFPIPGGTLPGVMTAGAAQLLLKSAGLRVRERTVLAGLGPLLWLTAWQHLNAGGRIEAVLETIPRGRLSEAMRHAPGFMFSGYLAKGLELVRRVRRRVTVVEHVESIAALGDGRVESVRYVAQGVERTIGADLLLLHQGIVPNVHLPAALGCDLRWNASQACFEPEVDEWGGSTLERVFIAGDGGGVAGAIASEARGRLVGLAALNALGRIDAGERDEAAKPERAKLATAMRGRTFLDALYRPTEPFRMPEGETIVCRCEEVTAEALRDAVRAGAAGPNQVRAWTRCGMGLCQGRQCGLAVSEIVAQERDVPPGEVGHLRVRFPTKPVTLGELAAWPSTSEAERAVNHDVPGPAASG